MNIQECYKIIDRLILKIDYIISKGAIIDNEECIEPYRDVCVQMYQLIRTLFPDADNRIKDMDESRDAAAKRDGPGSERTIFMQQAKTVRRYLVSIKDSLQLRESTEVQDIKLDKLKKQLGEKEVESKRREKVTETKFYGAAIEIIDRLREQLKGEKDIKEDMINLRNDINEIKEVLWKIAGEFNIEKDKGKKSSE